MKRLNLIQGTAEWRAIRAQYPCASEAPIIMGASRHMKRAELLRLKASGMDKEFSDFVQRMVLDKGHQVEGPARAITERQIGEPLYPLTALDDSGEYLASLDGSTMAEDILMEHKQWSEELAAAIRAGATEFPDGQEWQMEQQLIVAKDAEKVIFVCSDGTEERRVQMEYRRVPGRAEQLKAGWAQFYHDLEHGDHTPAPAKAVAAPVETLPAVSVRMDGALKVISNLDKLEPVLRAFIERIPAKPSTDQEFADTDAACKALKRIEEDLDAAEASALASLDAVEQMQRLKKTLHALARGARLQREKLVEARKVEIRAEEVARGKQALAEFIAGLNVTIGKPYMPTIAADFAGAIRGRKTVQSLRDAVDQELARAKIEGNTVCGRIVINMRALRELAAEHAFLFSDTATLVLKAEDDCRAQIESRIAAHRVAEERRLEAERARIRAEEQARADREAQERVAAEQRQREEDEADQRRAEQAKMTHPNGAPMFGHQVKENGDRLMLDDQGARSVFCDVDEGEPPAPAANVVPMPTKAPAAPPTLMLRDINALIAPLSIDAAGLASLGFPPAATDKNAKLYHAADFPRMRAAMVAHLQAVQLQEAA